MCIQSCIYKFFTKTENKDLTDYKSEILKEKLK